jgi:hypothetical protein
MIDHSRKLNWGWQAQPAAWVWHYPVQTYSLQDQKLVPEYQGSAWVLVYPLNLLPGEEYRTSIKSQWGLLT